MPTNWLQFTPNVLPDVPGCPVRVAENAIRLAAIDFCNETRVWRTRITDITTAADTPDYTLAPPADSEVMFPTKMQIDQGRFFDELNNEMLDKVRVSNQTEQPTAFSSEFPGQVTLYLTPDQVYTVKVWATLKPTKDSLSGPDFLYIDWYDEICCGAKSRLMLMNERPWGNVNLARIHEKNFSDGKVKARIRDAKANTRSVLRVRENGHGFYRGYRI